MREYLMRLAQKYQKHNMQQQQQQQTNFTFSKVGERIQMDGKKTVSFRIFEFTCLG